MGGTAPVLGSATLTVLGRRAVCGNVLGNGGDFISKTSRCSLFNLERALTLRGDQGAE